MWRKTLLALAIVSTVFCAATARLFVWPPQGMPQQVNAIATLDGPGNALDVGVHLAVEHRAPFLVVSQGTPASEDPCARKIRGVTVICFHPVPATTRGEAEFVGRLAKKYHWQSVAVVAVTPQAFRAQLRVQRCSTARVYVIGAPLTYSTWPYQIAYEWGALFKALVIQRAC